MLPNYEDEPFAVSCPACNGLCGVLGQLGHLLHLRCIDCGMDSSVTVRGVLPTQAVAEPAPASRLERWLSERRRSARIHYHVAPRYTAGSPAAVTRETAEKVAREEQQHIRYFLSGVYGEEAQQRAKALGLAGVAEVREETRKGWQVLDLCTGESFLRPFNNR